MEKETDVFKLGKLFRAIECLKEAKENAEGHGELVEAIDIVITHAKAVMCIEVDKL